MSPASPAGRDGYFGLLRTVTVPAVPLIDRFREVPAFEAHPPPESQWFPFGVGRVLIGGCVLACGRVEDVAARRKPTLLPGGRAARMGA